MLVRSCSERMVLHTKSKCLHHHHFQITCILCVYLFTFSYHFSLFRAVRLSIRPTDAYVVTFQKYFSFSFVCFVLWGGKSVDSTNSMNVTNVMYHWCVVPTYIHTYICMLLPDRVVWRRKNGSLRKKSGLFGIHVSASLRYFFSECWLIHCKQKKMINSKWV